MSVKLDKLTSGTASQLVVIAVIEEIVSITDHNGNEYKDNQKEMDIKACVSTGDKLTVKYRVPSKAQKISVWIEYEPSKIHEDFYKQYQKGSFKPPVVVTLVDNATKQPGVHQVEWDGRDQTEAKRLLLTGKYKVRIKGERVQQPKEGETSIVVGKPGSYNFGIHYKKGGHLESSKKETEHAKSCQEALLDTTAFTANVTCATDGVQVLESLKKAAVCYWSGHSNMLTIDVCSKENVNVSKADKSRLHVYGEETEVKPPDATLATVKAKELKDLFLVMLNGCRTGNETYLLQRRLISFYPQGIDGKHGEKTTKALLKYQNTHDLPEDGTKNEETLKRLGISGVDKTEKELTFEVQRKLSRYYPGKDDGLFGPKTSKAVLNYQEDHPTLTETGQADEATLQALKLGSEDDYALNIAQKMVHVGADLSIGFVHKIDFDLAEDWAIKFWDNLARGDGVNKAAQDAKANVDVRRRDQCTFSLYTQEKVSKEATLHPARYGSSA